jgi:hypothetical protein
VRVDARLVAEVLGDDPLRRAIRACLHDAVGRCRELAQELKEYVGPWELPSDIEEALGLTRTGAGAGGAVTCDFPSGNRDVRSGLYIARCESPHARTR